MHRCQPRIRRPRRLAIIFHTTEMGELGDGGSSIWGAFWGAFRVGPELALLAACSAA